MRLNLPPIQAFKDNYIWTWSDDSNSAWVVDPGDPNPVIDTFAKNNLQLAGILLTHHHRDHSGGIKALKQHWKDIPIFGSYKSPIKEITHPVREGDEVQCSPYKLKVLEIPGHTLDHVAFYNEQLLFCGDTLFSGGCGRIFEGTALQMFGSLNKLMQLSPEVQIYCGHEYTKANLNFAQLVEPSNPKLLVKIKQVEQLRINNKPTLPSTMLEEQLFNPFLRCDQPDVIQAVQKQSNFHSTNPVEVFAALREWKNKV